MRDDLHAERESAASYFLTDATEADEAERLAAQFGAGEGRLLPLAGVRRSGSLRNRTREAEHQRERVFGDADGVASGRVHDEHAAARGGVDVDVVHTYPGASDGAEPLRLFEKSGIDFGGAAHDESVSINDGRGQFGGGWNDNFPTCFTKKRETALTDFVCNDNFHGIKRVMGEAVPVNCGYERAILCAGENRGMSYLERIQSDLTAAMKEKDELRLSVLRMTKSALKHKEIEKMRALDDMESLQVLQTLVKQRRESVEQFTKGGRPDLAEKEKKEIAIIENYLPAAPSDAEVQSAIEEAIAESGADSLKGMGAVVKAARARLEGKTVDGKALSDRIRERLTPKS